jgi:hypothetical protein
MRIVGSAVSMQPRPWYTALVQRLGRPKNELFYARDCHATTIEQFTQALDAYIRWYNEHRIKISPGARSPVEYR